MCTVTYIPTLTGDYTFTSNRDEAPKRSAAQITSEDIYGKTLLYPKDEESSGSWIIISDTNQLVCILNGAFVRHERKLPYRLSRGIMAKEFFSYDNAETFIAQFDFDGIEPFTMIIVDQGVLYELKWDSTKLHIKKPERTQMHLWASSTLYDDELQHKRQQWFKEWKDKTMCMNQGCILSFHKNGGEGNPQSDVVMNYKDIVKTTSITSVTSDHGSFEMRFESLENQEVANRTMQKTTS